MKNSRSQANEASVPENGMSVSENARRALVAKVDARHADKEHREEIEHLVEKNREILDRLAKM